VAASWAKDSKEGRGQRDMKDAGEAKSSSRPATQLRVACSGALTQASAGTTWRVDDDGPEGSGGAEGGGGTEGGHNVEGSGGSTKSKMVQSEEVEATVGRMLGAQGKDYGCGTKQYVHRLGRYVRRLTNEYTPHIFIG
jgi:hypothetical protein